MTREEWDRYCEEQTAEHAARLAWIRARLGPRGGVFRTSAGLVLQISPNQRQSRDRYPWRVTTYEDRGAEGLWPFNHTEHETLDAEDDCGPYYHSAVWEIAYSVDVKEGA